MCRYRYMYYSGCCHAKLTLYDYCDNAYDAASLPTAPEGSCGVGDEDAHNRHLVQIESHPAPHLTECPSREDPQNRRAVEGHLIKDAHRELIPPRQTYASIARSAEKHRYAAQPQHKNPTILVSKFPIESPAQKLASQFEASNTANSPLTLTRKNKSATNLAGNGRPYHPSGSMPPPIRPGRERANHSATSAGGRRCSENTNISGGSMVPCGHRVLESNLPGGATEACAFDLNLRSPTDFPDLSLRTSGPSPASLISEAKGRSSCSTASWAQVAGLTSAVRSTHGSTSGNTAADSDIGTASATSLSSFQAEDFDGSFTTANMAPPGKDTIPVLRGKKLPPLTTTGLSGVPQNTRKTLPSEWLGSVPTGTSGDAMRRKSVPALRTAASTSKTASSPTKSTSSGSPTKSPNKSSTKSPTKVVPFRLETARRAKEREVKEKSGAEYLKGRSRKIAKDANDRPSSPGGLPSSTATAAKHSPLFMHTYYGYSIEDHSSTTASPPHSRIPRLCNKFRNQDGLLSTHSELNAAIEHRYDNSQAQPPQPETRANQGHQILVQFPTNIEQRRPSPTIQHIEDISLHPGSGPRSDDFINIGTARSEMMRSDEAIDKAETALGDIKRRMVSDGSNISEESTVILIDTVESDKPRPSASRARQGTYPGATPPLNRTQQHIFPREMSSGPDEASLVPHLRVTSSAGTDTVVTPNEPDYIVSPSQGTHWSTHYAQDLGRTLTPPTATSARRRIMSAPRVVNADPKILHVGPDVAKMSTGAVELLRKLESYPQHETPQTSLSQPQTKTTTAPSLNAQAKEFVPKALAQTHYTSGPFVITPNPGPGFQRPQLPSAWSNPTWVNAIQAPAFLPNSSAQRTPNRRNAQSQDASAAGTPDPKAAGPEGKNITDKKKSGKAKNRANKNQGIRVASTATSTRSGGANTNNDNDSDASPQHSATGSSTRASTPRLPPSSGYATPRSNAAALEDSTTTATGATTALTGPYAFRWESMRPSVFNLTTLYLDEKSYYGHGNVNHTYARAPPSSPLTANTNTSRRSNGATATTTTTMKGERFPSSLLRHRSCSPATPRPSYACAGGWRSVGGGPLRYESFEDLRARLLGPNGSTIWRPTQLRGGEDGSSINKAWTAGANSGKGRKHVDWSALGPCGKVQVAEAYEVLPHCPVAVCSGCLPDQKTQRVQ